MIFLPKNKSTPRRDQGKFDGPIAGLLRSFQKRLAGKLNHWINSRSKAGQKRILWLFCALFLLALAASSGQAFNGLTLSGGKSHQPLYIGQPSYRTGLHQPQPGPGDSNHFKK